MATKNLFPGAELAEMLKANGMNQKELAIRTGMTEKHISTVISGEKRISKDFSNKLNYVFEGLEEDYFYNKQLEYDEKKQGEEIKYGITKKEKDIYKQLKELIEYTIDRGNEYIHKSMTEVEKIVGIRKFLKVSNLELIPATLNNTAFRKSKNVSTNQYVLLMWMRMCEYYNKANSNDKPLNKKLLNEKINLIRQYIKVDINSIREKLVETLSECGIIFDVVPNFKGAPMQGFIKEEKNKQILMCITIRGKRGDSFWFTLFHEIGHVLNDDVKDVMVDIFNETNDKEKKADDFAANVIVNNDDYQSFINKGDYSLPAIEYFSNEQKIPSFMIIGRMQKDGIIEYSEYYEQIPMYEWRNKRSK